MAGQDADAEKTVSGRVLVIDDDEVARNMIANHLRRLGYAEVDLCADGEEGWAAIQRETYALIVLDWKLPRLSGLALFSRIRRRVAYRAVPLLVVSGLLEKHDFRLLQEFPCTALVEKPFTAALFQNRVEELLREATWYGQNVALIDGILQAVDGDGRKAEQLLKQVLKKAPNPVPLALIAARRLVRARLLKSAKSVLEAVLKVDEESVLALNELGKVLHLLGRHSEALDRLSSAHKLSPQNVQRLCLMGEVQLNLSDPDAAHAFFSSALAIDAEDRKAQAGQVVADNMLALLEAPAPLQVQLPKSFASLLNTMGIAFVRNGEFERGISQYQSALPFLSRPDDAARVAFNLGLGFLRWGRPNEALPWFRKAESLAPKGFGKAARYVRQLLVTGAGEAEARAAVKEVDFDVTDRAPSIPSPDVAAPAPAPEAAAAAAPAAPAQPGAPAAGGNLHDDVDEDDGKTTPLPVGGKGGKGEAPVPADEAEQVVL